MWIFVHRCQRVGQRGGQGQVAGGATSSVLTLAWCLELKSEFSRRNQRRECIGTRACSCVAWMAPQESARLHLLSCAPTDFSLLFLLTCRYVQQQIVNATGQPLSAGQEAELDFAAQLSGSSTHKARLLHYFPVNNTQQQQTQQQQHSDDDWCGWHLDHGSLTG